jgi:outer membrane immunogenic protein
VKKFLLAGVALTALLGGAASAADIPVKARPYGPPPAFTWTGFYIGAHVGGGWGTKEWDAITMVPGFAPVKSVALADVTGTHTVNGFLGGVQGGFNIQFGPTVWGVEAQWSGADVKGHGPCFGEIGFGVASFDTSSTCSTKVRSIGTIAARFGLAWDHTLVYVKGGGGWANDRFNLHSTSNANFPPPFATFNFGEITDTRWGGMVGAGVEQAIGGGWSAKVEYNYLHLGTKTYTFDGTAVTAGAVTPIALTTDITQNLHLIKFGINYRFGWGYGGGYGGAY